MSLKLANSLPKSIEAKTFHGGTVHLFANGMDIAEIEAEDFACVVMYWLTNTDLVPNDPRISLMLALRTLNIVPGYGGTRSLRYKQEAVENSEGGG